jgi:hypothetical protein
MLRSVVLEHRLTEKLALEIMLLTCVWATGYNDWDFYGFTKSLQANVKIVSQIRTASSFRMLSNSLFTYNKIIPHYIRYWYRR